MEDISLVLGIAILFLVRIGIPVVVLIVLGILIDRWQSNRDNSLHNQ